MTTAKDEKARIETLILAERDRYCTAVHEIINSLEFIYVQLSTTKKREYHQPVFVDGQSNPVNLPSVPGVYLVYRKNQDSPFYCGEANRLSDRVSFHFKDSKSVRNFSTLKKALPENERGLKSMAQNLKIRVVEIPFGRNDVEEFLHQKFKINTKKGRTRKSTVQLRGT